MNTCIISINTTVVHVCIFNDLFCSMFFKLTQDAETAKLDTQQISNSAVSCSVVFLLLPHPSKIKTILIEDILHPWLQVKG